MRGQNHRPNGRNRAFTLVEILIVVVILGILASIVVPQFTSASDQAAQATFANDLRVFVEAAIYMQATTGEWPEDSASGALPAGFDEYIDEGKWLRGTAIGGVWDAEFNSFGITAGLGVHFNGGPARDDAYMTDVDARFDNGDLNTGGFRKIAADRYYAILEE